MQLIRNDEEIAYPCKEYNGAINPTMAYLLKIGFTEVVVPVVPPTDEQIQAQINQNIDRLWNQAAEYEKGYIYGAALSMLTIGVIQGKPKALAITAWISSIWNEHYYPQKALVGYEFSGYDFSVCGPMPYSVPELSVEVFGG